MTCNRTVHVAVPVLNEPDTLLKCLEGLRAQNYSLIELWFCVNQPESWHTCADRQTICHTNQESLQLLQSQPGLHVIDKCSPGNGWDDKKAGVGLARKTLMDQIAETASPSDLILSLDADTWCPPDYVADAVQVFTSHPATIALAAPYYHRLTGDTRLDTAMLRYELYLRYYTLNMWRIGSPYNYTALGSAICLPVKEYRRMGGMSPRSSGEDFYFLQQLTKLGRVRHWIPSAVYPATRTSDRVPYGTGHALSLKRDGAGGHRYPLFSHEHFDDVGQTLNGLKDCYDTSKELPLTDFLKSQLNTDDPWATLRANHNTPERFLRACHERLDGLRTLQYLKAAYTLNPIDDTTALIHWMKRTDHPSTFTTDLEHWSRELTRHPLEEQTVHSLDRLRNLLRDMEHHYRKRDDDTD